MCHLHVLTLFCQFRSRSLHNFFTHSTSYYSEFTSVFVTDSQYHECICHRLTVSRVYLFCNAILAEREEASLQTDILASDSLISSSASAGVGICLANLAKDQIFL